MKRKSIFKISVLLLLCLTLSLSADEPVKRVMNFIAVMDLRCGTGIDKETGVALTEILINEMVKMKKYTVIDRANRDKILSEAGYQQAGCVDTSCTIEMGRQLGVGKIIIGSISKIGKTYVVNVQLINVETAAIETSASETCEGCEVDKLIGSISNAAHKLMGEEVAPPNAYSITLQLFNIQTGLLEKTVSEDSGSDNQSMSKAVSIAIRKLMAGVTIGAREGSDIEANKNDPDNTIKATVSTDRKRNEEESRIIAGPPAPRGKKILVTDLGCINSDLCGQMTDLVFQELVGLNYQVVDRASRDMWLSELAKDGFPLEKCLNDPGCRGDLIFKLGVAKVVTGSIVKK